MKKVILTKVNDTTIHVTSDENPMLGCTSFFKKIENEDKQFMIALCSFLGYDAASLLCFDDEEDINEL